MGDQPDFTPRSEAELAALPEQALVDHIVAAREAGQLEQARLATGILAFTFEPVIRARVRRNMSSKGPEAVEDVVMEVLASVIHSSFDGKVIGEFGAFLKTITARRVADHFRLAERHGKGEKLPDEHEGEEGSGVPIGYEDEDLLAVTDAVERVLERRNAMHQRVIRLYGPEYLGFGDLSAAEAAAEINSDDTDDSVTEPNVHQIFKRFKNDLGEELGLHG